MECHVQEGMSCELEAKEFKGKGKELGKEKGNKKKGRVFEEQQA